jgi:beta-glucanase (GH16 family)
MNLIHKNKIKSFSKYFLVALILINYSCETGETQTITTLDKLVWEDNFNRISATDSLPDATKWMYNTGTGVNGWGNNELQNYTDRPENVTLVNGMLEITAKQESFMGAGYTSGRILTKGLFQNKYGRYEARIKLPWGQGIWPAFWLLGDDANATVTWPQIGEIDIMENRGQQPATVHGSVHGPGYSAGEAITKSYTLENDRFDSDFHIFGIEWGPKYINFYVDNVLYNQITPADVTGDWVFDSNEFYIIMNLAVGGSFAGNPNSQTVFPQTMYVDYVRVYQ